MMKTIASRFGFPLTPGMRKKWWVISQMNWLLLSKWKRS